MALIAPFAVGFPGHPFHEPFHARGVLLPLCVKVSAVGAGRCNPSGAALDSPSLVRLAAWLSTTRAGASPRLGPPLPMSSTAPQGWIDPPMIMSLFGRFPYTRTVGNPAKIIAAFTPA